MKKHKSEGSLFGYLDKLEEDKIKTLNLSDVDVNYISETKDDVNSEKTWDNLITLDTFSDWISVAAYKIECLDLAITIYRWRLQTCILLGLLLSTASGTISVTQFGNYSPKLKFGLNLVLTITSFAVALLTGIVKTFKLQETLEEYIHLKQSWVSFSAKINNEIYLPKKMRGNAETIIKENKGRFLDLLKVDSPIPKDLSILAAKHLDKGDDIESQYYKYRDNIIKKEKDMNHNFMRCLSFFYNCCYCFYKKDTAKKIMDNRELAKTIKYSKIENATKYKRRAYQYTLSSIMLNNIKNEYNEVKVQTIKQNTIETQTDANEPPKAPVQDLKAPVQDLKAPVQDLKEKTPVQDTNPKAPVQDPKEKVPVQDTNHIEKSTSLYLTIEEAVNDISDNISGKKKETVEAVKAEAVEAVEAKVVKEELQTENVTGGKK